MDVLVPPGKNWSDRVERGPPASQRTMPQAECLGGAYADASTPGFRESLFRVTGSTCDLESSGCLVLAEPSRPGGPRISRLAVRSLPGLCREAEGRSNTPENSSRVPSPGGTLYRQDRSRCNRGIPASIRVTGLGSAPTSSPPRGWETRHQKDKPAARFSRAMADTAARDP
jgi:hypothetical protein